MKTAPLRFLSGLAALLALIVSAGEARATITYFYDNGGAFTRTDVVTLTQTGRVFIQTGGNAASLAEVSDNAYIAIDGTTVTTSYHTIRDASETAVICTWEATLPAGDHSITTSVSAQNGASDTFTYIELEDESGPLDQSTIDQITTLYQSADDQLRSDLTTIVQNTEAGLQGQIDAANASITQLQQDLSQQIAALQATQSTDETAIAQLQQKVAADEDAISALQAQSAAQQRQLQTLTDAEAAHLAALQSQFDALSSQVTTLNSTTVHKSNLNTYLLYGGAAAGLGGIGFGVYDTWFNRPDEEPIPSLSVDDGSTSTSDRYPHEN